MPPILIVLAKQTCRSPPAGQIHVLLGECSNATKFHAETVGLMGTAVMFRRFPPTNLHIQENEVSMNTKLFIGVAIAALSLPVASHAQGGAAAGATTGAVTGAIVGGPVGAAVGAGRWN